VLAPGSHKSDEFLLLIPYRFFPARDYKGVPAISIEDQVLSRISRATDGGNLQHGIIGWRFAAWAMLKKLVSYTWESP